MLGCFPASRYASTPASCDSGCITSKSGNMAFSSAACALLLQLVTFFMVIGAASRDSSPFKLFSDTTSLSHDCTLPFSSKMLASADSLVSLASTTVLSLQPASLLSSSNLSFLLVFPTPFFMTSVSSHLSSSKSFSVSKISPCC